ncbi:sugar-binding transcriptional regulator, partial [Pontimonas sp.]|nr:sugar-binding transcriptional regulator [Pontimonas sp.]
MVDKELLAVRAAELYYQENKTQDEIGALLHITRWKVSRLIAQAREEGIIRIEIVHPRARRLGLEHDVCAAY